MILDHQKFLTELPATMGASFITSRTFVYNYYFINIFYLKNYVMLKL